MAYLLDTNILSDLVRNPQGAVYDRIVEVGEDRVATSMRRLWPAPDIETWQGRKIPGWKRRQFPQGKFAESSTDQHSSW